MAVSGVHGGLASRRAEPPPVPEGLAPRPRVLDALDRARDARVICLQAPGGFGKTTALAQWVGRDSRPVVWLAVRPAAADTTWLAGALLEALADTGLVSRHVAVPGAGNHGAWLVHVLPEIENALSAVAEPCVVVVDDAGALTGTPWACLVECLAGSLPTGSQLALSTRDAVPASLWRLQSRGQVAVIDSSVLALDEAETARVVRSLGLQPSADQVRALVEITQGWPAAVYLAALSMRSTPEGRPPSALARTTSLVQYLREEIVGRLPVDDAAFLSRVSVLSALDPESCEEVSATPDARERLRRLATSNQLLVPLDDAGERFRMHPLLADALSEQLHERDPEDWRAAHLAASLVEEGRGSLDDAVHHTKLAGDDHRLAGLVWSHAGPLLGSGRSAVIQRWLEGLDEGRLGSECGLALSAAWAASHAGDMARMNRFALAASACAEAADPSFELDAELLGATIGAGGLDVVEASARRFIAGKPHDDPWQTLSHFLLGVALYLRDETGQGFLALGEGYRMAVALRLPVMTAHCLAGLADAAIAEGQEHKALTRIRELRELTTRHRIDTIATAAPIFTTSAVGYVLEGRFTDARREAARALRLTALMGSVVPWHAVQGRLALAQVNAALGDQARARMLLDEAGDAHGPSTSAPRLDRMYAQTADRLAVVSTALVGSSSLTTAEVRVLQYLPTHLSFPEIAEELFVSRHTVKTQALSAYRKLGVHTRTEAIDRARRAGLLAPR